METSHPEMVGQIGKVQDTLMNPDIVVRSRTDQMYSSFISFTAKRLLPRSIYVLVKIMIDDMFVITAYFTDTTKRGETVWERK